MITRFKIFEGTEDDTNISIPLLYIMKIDCSFGWREDILEKAGKIYGIFLVDKNNSNYNELHLHWLYNQVEKFGNFHVDHDDPDYSETDDSLLTDIEIYNGGSDSDLYLKLSELYNDCVDQHKITIYEIESAVNDEIHIIYSELISAEKKYEEFIDEIIEYFQGNHIY